MTTIKEFNRRNRISKLLKQRKRAILGNKRNSPSNLMLLPIPKPVRTRHQKTMSASGGRKRALPQRLVNPQKAGSTIKKGL